MSIGGMGPSAGRATHAHLALVPPMPPVFAPSPIKRIPQVFSRRGGGET
jgi:hypothetical protein